MEERKNSSSVQKEDFLDGIYTKNTVFVSGLVVAPVIAAAVTLRDAWALVLIFTELTFLTVAVASFVPRKTAYAVRIILYTIIAALVYVPVYMSAEYFFPESLANLGIFAPLLITNSLIVSKSETRFFRKPKKRMLIDLASYILGFDFAVLVFAFFREILATGSINEKILGIPMTFSALSLPFGGFLLLGLFSAAFRKIQMLVRSSKG